MFIECYKNNGFPICGLSEVSGDLRKTIPRKSLPTNIQNFRSVLFPDLTMESQIM